MQNTKLLDEIIVGRVEPQIYAFSTNTIPNYLKVGDTYRALSTRLEEWRKYFPNLKEEFHDGATVSDELFFRDFSVHQYLESELGKERLLPEQIDSGIYYSKEFFKDASSHDVEEAIEDIRESYEKGTGKYQFYSSQTHLPETFTYSSTGTWKPRPNQKAAVDAFKKAVKAGRTNLLMYAVMRFGKSFTSMLCANAIDAGLVLIVSAKADVREEWKKTVQSADNFNAHYEFVSSDDLIRDENRIGEIRKNKKGAVVFLTLQDLQGNEIKDKHKELFSSSVDLLIVDETHYGARAEKYGQVLRGGKYEQDVKHKYASDDFVDIDEAEETLKVLDAKIRLHLSGTPYRILMGSEFSKEDIIAFCQFSDIVHEQEEWDKEHILSDDYKEWDNPYFGFPQMIRFAFYPSEAAKRKLEELKKNGHTYAFSALLKPQSIKKDDESDLHKKFVYESEVLDLLEAIDGSKTDENVLSFLNYDKIKEGNMCRHIVMVLPYCASCDAMEALIENNGDKFKNLKQYKIINISGVDSPSEYKKVQDVKTAIKKCEEAGQKTITLTVNRMLTGSTVEEWDTMIYLKDTSSPQEYDQAIFRLQNQYVRTMIDDASEDEIKFNMKPQTLLVDFDPHRMFVMQEQKSLIYNANVEEGGNSRLKERITEELRISPIITLNKDRIERVEPVDILQAVSEYSSSRGVMDESRDIPVDFSLLDIDAIRTIIEMQAEIGSNKGFETESSKGFGEGQDYEGTETDDETTDNEQSGNDDGEASGADDIPPEEDDTKTLENKFRTYYSRILFYAFLTKNRVSSLEDIVQSIKNKDNERIARNLSLDYKVLSALLKNMNAFILSQLDYKIQNINQLANDENVEPIERALTAIRKFERLSASEVATPVQITNEMINLIPDNIFLEMHDKGHAILDVASKAGEYAIAIVHRCEKIGIELKEIESLIMSIPTSSVAYEFTRKIYEVLGLDIDCIATKFTSYDCISETNNATAGLENVNRGLSLNIPLSQIALDLNYDGGNNMIFDAIVGNPPYQQFTGGGSTNTARQAKPIYQFFVQQAIQLNPKYLTMIIPSRWFAGGMGMDSFRNQMMDDGHITRITDYPNAKECFPQNSISGGVSYFLRESDRPDLCDFHSVLNGKDNSMIRPLNEYDVLVRYNQAISVIRKIDKNKYDSLSSIVSPISPFGITTKIRGNNKKQNDSDIKLYSSNGESYIPITDDIKKNM